MGNALISPCGKYRYWLKRSFFPADPPIDSYRAVIFVMLNPSTADASVDDPTIKRCIKFAERWGYSSLIVINLYAYRSTDPKKLWGVANPVGPENDIWIRHIFREYPVRVVCAWGDKAKSARIAEFLSIVFDYPKISLWCLGRNNSGSPKHPLYLKASQPLVPWSFLKEYHLKLLGALSE